MHAKRPLLRMIHLLGAVLALLLLTSSAAFAQGSIFGTVQNSDLTFPANGEISFVGFLDNTDEEIRIETSSGAGFDAGNWFDDFQNYLTEAPGNPYVYYFHNVTNGQGAVLSKTIPSNSFQQENILLGTVTRPVKPVGLAGNPVSSSSIVVAWNGTPGVTYHVYRRLSTSSGSFFRIDDPTGSVANPGVADSFFVDNNSDGVSSYDYLVIAEDGVGSYSEHSDVITVINGVNTAPTLLAVTPDNGSAVGGNTVTITGTNFDINSTTASIGGAALTGITVVSPYELTGLAPAGVTGAADVVVFNSSSALSSNILVGGYTFNANADPVLATISAQSVDENSQLTFVATATDVDLDIPVMTSSTLPAGATYTDNLNGTATFDWTPTFTDAGSYDITFYATDGSVGAASVDSEIVTITVNNVNQDPILAAIGAQATDENVQLTFITSASDADGDIPIMTANNLPTGATYINNLDGTATFDWTPTFADSGVYTVSFLATDAVLGTSIDSEVVTITVNNINQEPVLAAIGAQGTTEGVQLTFVASASDADGDIPLMTSSALPVGATYTDNLDGTGTFDWTPTVADAGAYDIMFYATDGVFGTSIDSELVTVTVTDVNQEPVLAAIGAQAIDENLQLTFGVSATDGDGSIPVLSTSTLPAGATFTDNLDGTGSFDWTPSFVQAGAYPIMFYATDAVFGTSIDSEEVTITVNEVGNQLPVLAAIGAQAVVEGGTLNLLLSATDPEGAFPTFSATSIPTNATLTDNLDGTASFVFNPDLTQEGIYNVTFIATDDSLATASEIVEITVAGTNQEPVLAAIGDQTIDEDFNLNFDITAVDGDGAIPVLTTSALPAGAAFVDNLDGTGNFDWTPTFADDGVYSVTFYATDAVFASAIDSEVITITVNDAGNQFPVLTAIGPQAIAEGSNLNLLMGAIDPDGTIPTFSADSLPLNSTFTDNLDGTATFDFTPDFTQAGAYNVIFIASDGLLADSEVVVITVNEVGNLAPTITAINDTTINEGGLLVMPVTSIDQDGNNISLTVSTTLSNFTFADNGDGTGLLTYSPTFIDADVDTVRFIAIDDGTPQQSSTELVVLTTVDVNQPPVFDSIGTTYTVAVNGNLSVPVAVTDSTDPVPSNVVILTATGLPINAAFVNNGDNTGLLTFAPVLGQEGSYTVTIFATDQGSPQGTASLPLSITVVGINQPPVLAEIGPQTVLEGATLTLFLSATDADGTIPVMIGEKLPENSTFVDNSDGTATFIFNPSFLQAGLHSATFKAYDGISIDKEIVLIQVYEAGNQAPAFTSLPFTQVTEGTTVEGIVTAADPEEQPITISVDAAGITMDNFTLVDSGNGVASFIVSPNFQQAGIYDLSMIVSDGEMADTSILSIEVIEAGNQAPELLPLAFVTSKEGVNINFHVFATDLDGDYPIMTAANLPGTATFLDITIGEGIFNWTPGATSAGTYEVSFYAEDRVVSGVFDSTVVTFNILDSNYSPTIRPDPVIQNLNVNEGGTLIYNVLAADADGDVPTIGARMSGSAIGDPLAPNMVFVDNGDGTGVLTFNPDHTQGAANPTKYFMVFYAIDAVDPTRIAEYTGVTINVFPQNIAPTMTFSAGTGPFSVTEGENLNFDVVGYDIDGLANPTIIAENLPASNVILSGASDSIHFDFNPSFTQAGQYQVRFIVTDDMASADSQDVVINVVEAGNQNPFFTLEPPANLAAAVGTTFEFDVSASDPEGGLITLTASPAITNGNFVDFGDGSGTYFFSPDASQLSGVFAITVIAQDPLLDADTTSTTITVVSLMRGDADFNQFYTMNDIVYLISYIFRSGNPPQPLVAGDVDNSGAINISDIAYLVNYMYKAGPRPPQ